MSETAEMKAGRELDSLVAEKVMGWRRTIWPSGSKFLMKPDEADKMVRGSDTIYGEENDKDYYASGKEYSTCISDAWEVVEKLRDYQPKYLTRFGIVLNFNDGQWCVGWMYDPEEDAGLHPMIEGRADTAPLAICLAALKVMEHLHG